MTEQQQQVATAPIPVTLINAIYQYLGTQSYKQVSPLMKALETLSVQPAPEEVSEEPEKTEE